MRCTQAEKNARQVAAREGRLVDDTNWPRDFNDFNDARSGSARYLATADEWRRRAALLRNALPASINGRRKHTEYGELPDHGFDSVPSGVYRQPRDRRQPGDIVPVARKQVQAVGV